MDTGRREIDLVLLDGIPRSGGSRCLQFFPKHFLDSELPPLVQRMFPSRLPSLSTIVRPCFANLLPLSVFRSPPPPPPPRIRSTNGHPTRSYIPTSVHVLDLGAEQSSRLEVGVRTLGS